MWIVKPAENTNRGRGITIHNDLSEISQIISSNEKHSDGSLKTYIVQIYIEKPFLYNRRKFDIRCYMLVSLLVQLLVMLEQLG
jgi:glutathione synthase/RimK-type ligase-like ATP-grasp enzyme